jgi:hypothetical protein
VPYSSHGNDTGHVLEVDRDGDRLLLVLWNLHGERLSAEFTLAEAEAIATSISRVCRVIRAGR